MLILLHDDSNEEISSSRERERVLVKQAHVSLPLMFRCEGVINVGLRICQATIISANSTAKIGRAPALFNDPYSSSLKCRQK